MITFFKQIKLKITFRNPFHNKLSKIEYLSSITIFMSLLLLPAKTMSQEKNPLVKETVWETAADPGGNGGITFTSMHPTSGHIYTSSDMTRSLFRTVNRAETWQQIANPVGTGTAYYIAGDPSNPIHFI